MITVRPIFKGLYFNTCTTIGVGVFGVLPYLFPREIGS
jgi:hypothetical protein